MAHGAIVEASQTGETVQKSINCVTPMRRRSGRSTASNNRNRSVPDRADRPSPRRSSRPIRATRLCGSGGRRVGLLRWCGRWSSGPSRCCKRGWGRSSVSTTINTSFVERNHGTDRHQNSRKRAQDETRFSKELGMHRGGLLTSWDPVTISVGWVGLLRVCGAKGCWRSSDPGDGRGIDRPHLEPRRVGDLFRRDPASFSCTGLPGPCR